MDFGHFGDGPRDQNGGQNQTPATPIPQNGANGGQSNSGTEQPIFMHTMSHPGVTCDVCSGEIRGFRYKCMECVDFDLCTTCERKGNHPGHVMMRIAFPEQTRGAMQRFLGTTGIGFGRHHGGGVGGGLFGVGFPFETQGRHHGHHRDRGCHRRAGHASGRDSEGDSGPEDPKGPNDCPYGLGRKGMKKWAKCMKKMAYQHRRSAEAYAKSATQAATGSCASAAAAGFPGQDSEPRGPSEAQQQQAFDFTSAASQIQEFLNAFGIPIDVVELYDNYGNRGQPRTDTGNSTTSQPMTTPTGNTAANVTHGTEAANEGQEQQSTTTEGVGVPQTNLAAHMQQLHLNGLGVEPVVASAPSAPEEVSAAQSVNMDLDADSSGWTLLDTDRAPGSVGAQQNESAIFGPPPAATISNGQPIAPATTETTTTGIVPPNAQTPTGRLYPGLNPPQLQQLLSGVSQAMNSMVRNIPIVTNPGGPGLGTNSGPPSYGNGSPEMDVRCTTTLNQLLAMGFSNADGWLSRLVVAKNGDLETILNALFPVGGGQ